MDVNPQIYFILGFAFLGILTLLVGIYYVFSIWGEMQKVKKANCLLWRHPDKIEDLQIELVNIPAPPGGDWDYKALWFMAPKPVKWCYEVMQINEETGEKTYIYKPYVPDEHIDSKWPTSAGLADVLDWRPAKRILMRKAQMMQKLAQGGVIILGCASIFGIMALLDMLGKG